MIIIMMMMMMMMMVMMTTNCFFTCLTEKRHAALFPVDTNVRDPLNRESPTHCQQSLNMETT